VKESLTSNMHRIFQSNRLRVVQQEPLVKVILHCSEIEARRDANNDKEQRGSGCKDQTHISASVPLPTARERIF